MRELHPRWFILGRIDLRTHTKSLPSLWCCCPPLQSPEEPILEKAIIPSKAMSENSNGSARTGPGTSGCFWSWKQHFWAPWQLLGRHFGWQRQDLGQRGFFWDENPYLRWEGTIQELHCATAVPLCRCFYTSSTTQALLLLFVLLNEFYLTWQKGSFLALGGQF